MHVLVTGGAGYVGSHAALCLLRRGYAVTIVDDLSRGRAGAVERLAGLGEVDLVCGSAGDRALLYGLMRRRQIDAVMHFAALAYVEESVHEPLRYYRNNLGCTLALLEAMAEAGVGRLVFSSTCAVYGEPSAVPIAETAELRPVNPYGRSKYFVESVLRDHQQATAARGDGFAYAALRYFNVAGCDRSGRLGEDHDPETHLIPRCLDAALGRLPHVTIFGTDYETPDGSAVRDFVHVDDVADAHAAVLEALGPCEARTYNIGIGRGRSVQEVIEACRLVTGREIAVLRGPRRAGDPPVLCADPALVHRELGWKASVVELGEMVETAWKWRRDNPGGYPTPPR
jgi:UDP-glucose 4-epimerase